MKTSKALLLMLLFVFATLCSLSLAEDQQDICFFFKNNTKVRDPDSCNKYITCIDHTSHFTTCTGSTPFYDKESQKCVKSLDSEDIYCAVSCVEHAGHFIGDPKSCKGYYYCHDEETATPGTCPEAQHFNATLEACIYKHESECRTSQFEFCAIVKKGTSFRHETACHQYYSCSNTGELTMSTCASGKYWDPIKGSCAAKATVPCVEHPLPDDVCGKPKSPKKNAFVSDDVTCRGYFFCAEMEDGTPDDNPSWNQCPPDTFFNKTIASCDDPMSVKCAADRCEGRTKQFVTAGTKGCRHYNRCVDGVTTETLTCGNLFFDEKQGVCTTEIPVPNIACIS